MYELAEYEGLKPGDIVVINSPLEKNTKAEVKEIYESPDGNVRFVVTVNGVKIDVHAMHVRAECVCDSRSLFIFGCRCSSF